MEHIIYQLEEDLAILTLNRPEVANGFHIPMCEEILEALTLAEEDPAVHFVLINAKLVNTISYKIKQIAKPVLMEVDGAVAGAAANMAVAADFCLATDKAKFIQAFVGVGLAPDAGGIHLLSRSIGVTRAAQLAMTGEALSAEKALEWGLVYRVSEADKLEKTREQLLKKLRRGSANSYAAIKKLVWESQFKDWQDYAALELNLQESLAKTEDFKEGVRAHSERRRPKFTGK